MLNHFAILEGRDLARSFGSTAGLRCANLSVNAGEMVAIVGPSGSGKSTLMHCLAGILQPDKGEVLFNGKRFDKTSDAARTKLRRDEFGFVFQFSQLVEELTAIQNVALPLMLRGTARRKALSEAEHWLDVLSLTECSRRRPSQLSGGQGQRIAVARAMITTPAVIFADEPTGSLDSTAGATVLALLENAVSNRGTSVVLVTHDNEVARRANRIVEVRDGVTVTADKIGQA